MKNSIWICLIGILTTFVLAVTGGCSKDSSSNPVDSPAVTTPTVSASWRGSAKRADGSLYSMTVSIAQNGDKLAETCFWSSGSSVKAIGTYNGTVTTSRLISLQGVKYHNNPIQDEWAIDNHTATLSANGDTISGSFAAVSTSSPNKGTFVLLKQPASETYPTVAPSWAGSITLGTESYRDTAYILQALNLVGGTMVITSGPGWTTTEYCSGSVTVNRDVSFTVSVIVSSIAGWEKYWSHNTYKGKLSAAGDSLNLPYTFTEFGGGSGNLTLVKR
jgi:hypothetical protein